MITGVVNSELQATLRLSLLGPEGQAREVVGVIDTGFNGFLTVPPAMAASLRLPRIGRGRAILADGTEDLCNLYAVTVIWGGSERVIEADEADTDVLLGMGLLEGCDLSVRVLSGGGVAVQPVP